MRDFRLCGLRKSRYLQKKSPVRSHEKKVRHFSLSCQKSVEWNRVDREKNALKGWHEKV